MRPLAVGRLFRGLSALPVLCPYGAVQATGLAGGYDFMAGTNFSERFSDKNLFIAACVCYNIKNEIFSNSVEKIIALLRLMGKGEKKYAEK